MCKPLQEDQPVDAPLAFEPYDFVAAVHRHPDHPNRAVVYLIPSKVAAPEMKRHQKAWIEADPDHDQDNRVFVIHFDDAPARGGFDQIYGYAAKWAKYRIGEVRLSEEETGEPATSRLDEVIAEARRKIASEAGRPESAVRIAIDY